MLEQKEVIDKETLEIIAGVLKVPVEAIENFDEEAAVQIIANTFHDNAVLNGYNHYPIFHPLDKVIELYERMLKERDEEIAQKNAEIELLRKSKK